MSHRAVLLLVAGTCLVAACEHGAVSCPLTPHVDTLSVFDGTRIFVSEILAIDGPPIAGMAVGVVSEPRRARFVATETAIRLVDDAGEARLLWRVHAWLDVHRTAAREGADDQTCGPRWVSDTVQPEADDWTTARALRLDLSVDQAARRDAFPIGEVLEVEPTPLQIDVDDDLLLPTYREGRLTSSAARYALTDPACDPMLGPCTTMVAIRHDFPLE